MTPHPCLIWTLDLNSPRHYVMTFETTSWYMKVLGRIIDYHCLGPDSQSPPPPPQKKKICEAVMHSRACEGRLVDGNHTKRDCFLVEKWRRSGQGATTRWRSVRCCGILSIVSKADHCRSCGQSEYDHFSRKQEGRRWRSLSYYNTLFSRSIWTDAPVIVGPMKMSTYIR